MKSKFMTLQFKDFMWGFIYALTPVVLPLQKIFSDGQCPTGTQWYHTAMTAIPVVVVYLVVHFFKNSKGNIGPEQVK